MKYIVMLGDGMADRPAPELDGKTPLELAKKPNMDFLAAHGMVGICRTVPEGMPPGSDTANLSVMGYDPAVCYSGRSPLEAVSMGIDLQPDDVTFRCNLVTLSDEENYEDCTMVDYCAGDISTEEAAELVHFLDAQLGTEERKLYAGISYRHCLVMHHAQTGSDCTPPHDISLKPIKEYLPKGRYGEQLLALMKRSRELLKDHPVNQKRVKEGKNPATSCWFWGEGTKPALESFRKKFGVRGGVISAVDLIKGIGICAGLKSVDVPGATGYIDTNFRGKAEAAWGLLQDGCDMVYIHVEAPDECGHRHEPENKVKSIELIDREILGYLIPKLQESGEPFSILLMPDHPTPLEIRTHSGDPVPFVLYRSNLELLPHAPAYTEKLAEQTGVFVPQGHLMMAELLEKS